jgi:hypothetical protein
MYEWFVCGRSQTFASASGGCVRSIHGHICICIYVYVYVRVCMNECACMHVLYVRMNSHLLTHICPHTYSFALEFIIEIHTHTNPQSLSHTHTCKPHTHMQTTHTHANHTHTCKPHTHMQTPHTHTHREYLASMPSHLRNETIEFLFRDAVVKVFAHTHIMLCLHASHIHIHTYHACTHHISTCTYTRTHILCLHASHTLMY